jgi:hypothetical protein
VQHLLNGNPFQPPSGQQDVATVYSRPRQHPSRRLLAGLRQVGGGYSSRTKVRSRKADQARPDRLNSHNHRVSRHSRWLFRSQAPALVDAHDRPWCLGRATVLVPSSRNLRSFVRLSRVQTNNFASGRFTHHLIDIGPQKTRKNVELCKGATNSVEPSKNFSATFLLALSCRCQTTR